MGNKTKIPQERADMYKELLGEQKGDKVTITGNRDRKKDTSAFVTNVFTTILAACKWIAVLIPFIALITYSVIESISYFKCNLSIISDKTFSKIFSLFFDYIVVLFKPLVVTILFIAIALVIFNFIEFLYYSILYIYSSHKADRLYKESNNTLEAISNKLEKEDKENPIDFSETTDKDYMKSDDR